MVSVVIPALNEEETIADVVEAFRGHAQYVFVAVDERTTDRTAEVAVRAGAITRRGGQGKGQAIIQALAFTLVLDDSPVIVFCDADIRDIGQDDVTWLLGNPGGVMRILVPHPVGVPPAWEWRAAYPAVSGVRSVPWRLIGGVPLHGYLMETQLNKRAGQMGVPIRYKVSASAIAPFRFDRPGRMEAMSQDYEWGKANGVLDA